MRFSNVIGSLHQVGGLAGIKAMNAAQLDSMNVERRVQLVP